MYVYWEIWRSPTVIDDYPKHPFSPFGCSPDSYFTLYLPPDLPFIAKKGRHIAECVCKSACNSFLMLLLKVFLTLFRCIADMSRPKVSGRYMELRLIRAHTIELNKGTSNPFNKGKKELTLRKKG